MPPTIPDLENWSFVGDIFPASARPDGIYFRPKVIRNAASGEFVLWVNHLPPASTPLESYPDARLMVATSPSPDGTFQGCNFFSKSNNCSGGYSIEGSPCRSEVKSLCYPISVR